MTQPLTFRQQSLLFFLNLPIDDIQFDECYHPFCYYHLDVDQENECEKYEEIFDAVKGVKYEKVNVLPGYNKEYEIIYVLKLPVYILHYIKRGMSKNMMDEVGKVRYEFKIK